jgi:signal peptidase II
MLKNKARKYRLLLALLISFSCIVCDQATKDIATRALEDAPPKSFLADTIRLDYSLNPGGFLSLGSSLPPDARRWIFISFTSCTILALFIFLCLKPDIPLPLFTAFVLILAGGIGNLIDRVWNHGLVRDFINIGIGPVRTGIFNLADIAVTVGAAALLYLSFRNNTDR